MFFSVVVLVLTKALVAGKITLIMMVGTGTKSGQLDEKVSASPGSHSEATTFGFLMELR